jgi:hypothetical protein
MLGVRVLECQDRGSVIPLEFPKFTAEIAEGYVGWTSGA